ncbi:MAG: SRPBCC family protein [Ilumatobacteraceae bacterium]
MTDPPGEPPVIEQTTRIAAAPETVWKFWTEPALMCQWLGVRAEVVAELGGIFRVTMGDGPVMRGQFVEVDPPRRLIFTFGWEQNPHGEQLSPGSTRVEVRLVPDDGDTIVTLRHWGVPDDAADDHREGWRYLISERLVAAVSGR